MLVESGIQCRVGGRRLKERRNYCENILQHMIGVSMRIRNEPGAFGLCAAAAMAQGRERVALPDLPTLAEADLPNQDSDTILGILVPAGTPPAIIAVLHRERAQASIFALGPRQTIPWHCHSEVTDHCFGQCGNLTITMRDPDSKRELRVGERHQISP
jgi:hypothetical protein